MFYPEYTSIPDYTLFEKFMFTNTNTNTNVNQLETKQDVVEPKPKPKKEKQIDIIETKPKKEKQIEIVETKQEVVEPKQIEIVETKPKKEETIYSRLEKECICAKSIQDGLFWSMYILHHGYTEYNRNKYNYGKVEVQEKEKIAEYLHKNGSSKISKQTNYKLTRGFCCEIESDLITKPKMSFSGLIGMCAYYECNIIIVDLTKKIYYNFSNVEKEETENVTYILYKNPLYTNKHKSNEYYIDIDHKIYSLLEIKEMFFRIENYQKPMKSITNYKKTELEFIAEKIFQNTNNNNNNNKPLDKSQLYEKILLFICSNNDTEL